MANRLPIDYPITPNTMFPNGTVFVRLPTLDALRAFWEEHKGNELFQYAATGEPIEGGQWFLEEYEWVFGPTKEAVIDTIYRWEQLGIKAVFNDLRESSPEELEDFRADAKAHKADCLARGDWSPEQEMDFLEFVNGYVGDWDLKNLPGQMGVDEIIQGQGKIQDRTASPSWVEKDYQRMIFDEFSINEGVWDIRTMPFPKVEDEIRYWETERLVGEDYYGQEHEGAGFTIAIGERVKTAIQDEDEAKTEILSIKLTPSQYKMANSVAEEHCKSLSDILMEAIGRMI